ncbi:MAG: prolyl oligopeptidase family serine peptidase [Proteobacteria bacterium]|nr:prolyl oligopeptidase family serine peptidase [Pseudomonadota bacterium]
MTQDDPFLWLEDVLGERALAWVRERNALTEGELQSLPGFEPRRLATLQVLDSQDRIPVVHRLGEHFYNLWQDAEHPRGLWRRTTLDEYRRPQPAWETVLDLDALGAAEGENWVWGGADALGPAYRRCLLFLSRGGADAQVVREFDLVDQRFVDGGFFVPEAKSSLHWIDDDTLYIGSDFGPGSLTDSGYPRVIKRWRRGQTLADAVTVFEGASTDVAADAWVDRTPGFQRSGFYRSVGFYDSKSFLLQADGALQPTLQPISKPDDAAFAFWRDRVLIQLRSDWTVAGRTWLRGSLLVADADAYLRGERELTAQFTPSATRSLASYSLTRSAVLLNLLDNVGGRLEELTPQANGWQRREVATPGLGTLAASALHDPLLGDGDALAEAYWLRRSGFLEPDTLELARTGSDQRTPVKALPAFFDASGMRVEQRFARSADGTRVPYFIAWPRQPRNDGRNPTLLYGYGGFEVALAPWYLGAAGRTWLEPGGVFVVANLRGGGEFGPEWHQAAIKANKQKSYDDFAAVAEDLIAAGITRPEHLGIQGGSNGGLLVGAVMLQRPELFGAVVCRVPLLDMRRFHKLLAGASWMAEYGDPDRPEDWAWISAYSPYQKLLDLAPERELPAVLFITSTRDDRVHPGHARKMAARLLALGRRPLYWENIEGGHGGAADNAQNARMRALEMSFLWQRLGAPA